MANAVSRWVQSAEAVVPDGALVEVSPLISYAGEDLEERCQDVECAPGTTHVS